MDTLQTPAVPPSGGPSFVNKRPEFLLEMYKQMMNDINRHILVVWQSVGAVVGSFAILALVEKRVISLDIAAVLVLLICSWSVAHVLDAGYWYNRNLCIIANIERQFLLPSDLRDIHYYFGKHRPKNAMLTHLGIQAALAGGISFVILVFHVWNRVMPGFNAPWKNFDPFRAVPYAVALIAGWLLVRFRSKLKAKYDEFVSNSPGIPVNTSGVAYGIGHGFEHRSS